MDGINMQMELYILLREKLSLNVIFVSGKCVVPNKLYNCKCAVQSSLSINVINVFAHVDETPESFWIEYGQDLFIKSNFAKYKNKETSTSNCVWSPNYSVLFCFVFSRLK
jgi:hypothetical protein